MTIYLYTFLSVIAVSLISFIGLLLLSWEGKILRKYIFVFISVAVGALLGDAFIHLIPEAFEVSTNPLLTSVLIISGIFSFFIIEKFLHWHHHGEDEEAQHIHPVGKLMLISDGVHNVLDGIVIAASFLVSVPVGIATSIAVILHEIPQEVGDFAVLIHSGYSRARALWLNFLSAISAIFGVLLFFALGEASQAASLAFVPIAAGGFIYIAVADLIPELQKTKEVRYSVLQAIALVAGVVAMLGLTFLE